MLKKILIVGATGLLGVKILNELLNSRKYEIGIMVRSLDLRIDELSNIYDNKVKYFEGDILDINSILLPISWGDIIINVTGFVSYHKYDKKRLNEINVVGTRNIIETCSKFNKKLIHTSSVAVYGWTKKEYMSIEESMSLNSIKKTKSAYYQTKYDSDILVKDARISRIILRPSTIIDSRKSTAKDIYNFIKNGLCPLLPGGASFASTSDISQAYLNSVELIDKFNNNELKIFNLGGNNIKFNDLTKYFIDYLSKRTIKIPYFLIRFVSFINDLLIEKIFNKSIITSESARVSGGYSYVDSSKAKSEIGYNITAFSEAIKEIL
jgi:dihydroflavonol-4-reductase